MLICSVGSAKTLSIYYISHSVATNEKALIKALHMAKPVSQSESAIFYMANSEKPLISYINYNGVEKDGGLATIYDEIEDKSTHEVYPNVDLDKLCEIFSVIENDKILGKVREIVYNGSNILLGIEASKNFYIPYRGNFIKKVNVKNGEVMVENAEGLIL